MISIIGSGRVGSALAFLVAANSLEDVILVNRSKEKALGHTLDISNSIPENSSFTVEGTDDYSKIKNSNVIIITASAGTYTSSRSEILPKQASMMRDIATKIKKYNLDAKILVVSNPVDPLTYIFHKGHKLPRNNVIGVASSLDSIRFRYLLAKELGTNSSEIDGFVLGEHGDSMVPVYSLAKWNGKPIPDVLTSAQIDKITNDLKNYWKILRQFKGPSIYGIAKKTYDIVNALVKSEELHVPASVLLDGEYGLSDVCLGVPIKISKDGSIAIEQVNLDDSELRLLKESAVVIKKDIEDCQLKGFN